MTFKNTIIRGNCLTEIKKIKNNSIDLIIADPPFNVLNKADLELEGRTPIVQNTAFDHFKSYEEYMEFNRQWLTLLTPKMKKDCTLYIFFATQYISDLLKIAESLGFIRKNVCIWKKNNPAPRVRKTNYVSSYESIIVLIKGHPVFHFSTHNQMYNVLECPIPSQNERLKVWNPKEEVWETLHPTQKPLELIKKLIQISSDPHMLIVDPFVGTGTSNIAALLTSRSCIGFEKDELYFTHAKKRLTDLVKRYGEHQFQPNIERYIINDRTKTKH